MSIATLDTDLRQAMRGVLAGIASMPETFGYENVEFAPPVGADWWTEARLMPLPREAISLGAPINFVTADYLYEIHIGTPRLIGPERLEAYAGALMLALRPGFQFDANGSTFRVTQAMRSSIMFPDERPLHAVLACTFSLVSRVLNS